MDKTLLPSGLYDLLPPFAGQETHIINSLLGCFGSFGYEHVCPPLLEFEETLFAGRGETLSNQTFRVMDPISRQMMGFRADMTLQVARIALERMENAPRPLRLCYAGQALRVKSEKLRTERQLTQAGVELIGASSPYADAEVIQVAAEALERIGVSGISIDLNLPGLVPMLLDANGVSGELREQVEQAVARKDATALGQIAFADRDVVIALLNSAGLAKQVMPALLKLKLPKPAYDNLLALEEVIALVSKSKPSVTLTVDVSEFRGLEYHSGISFSIFARSVKDELGRGGRYQINGDESAEATGFTLYVGTLLTLVKDAPVVNRVFVACDTAPDVAAKLRDEGYATIHGLNKVKDNLAEARRLRCTHALVNGKVQQL